MSSFRELDPVLQALLARCVTWALTAAGAGIVLFTRGVSPRVMDSMLGFAAGVMIAASYWSLLAPSIKLAEVTMGAHSWVPAVAGFLAGGLFLFLVDKLVPHLHPGFPTGAAEGIHTSWRRSVLLVLAITIHNIPEGLAVGVAFGAAAAGLPGATLGAAIALTLGIAIQNFPMERRSRCPCDARDSRAGAVSGGASSPVSSSLWRGLPGLRPPCSMSLPRNSFPKPIETRTATT